MPTSAWTRVPALVIATAVVVAGLAADPAAHAAALDPTSPAAIVDPAGASDPADTASDVPGTTPVVGADEGESLDLSGDMIEVPSTPITRPHLQAAAAETAAREPEAGHYHDLAWADTDAGADGESAPESTTGTDSADTDSTGTDTPDDAPADEARAADTSDATTSTTPPTADASTAVEVHRISVSIVTVTASTADDQRSAPDDASVATAISQLRDYWAAESGGTVDVRLDAVERTSLNRSTCDPSSVLDTVHTTAFGGSFASYRWAGTGRHLLVLTQEVCGSAAFGTVGGGGGEIFSSVGTDTALGVPVLLHEFGHNLGFGHAGAGMCRSADEVDAPIGDYRHASDGDTSVRCPVEEYGDFLDIMGYSVSGARPHLSTPQRIRAGFLTDGATLTEPGSRRQVAVGALDGPASGRAVQVVDPLSGDVYWLEYRTASGADASSAEFWGAQQRCSSLDSRLLRCALTGDRAVGEVRVLRAIPLFGSAVSTVAVAAGPQDGDTLRRETFLDPGEEFTSTGGGFTVSVLSASPSKGAVLDVALAGSAPTTDTKPVGGGTSEQTGEPAPVDEPVAPAATTTALSSDRARQTWGAQPTALVTVRVAVEGGAPAAGTVALLDGAKTLGEAAVPEGGAIAFRLPTGLAPGSHSLRAAFTPAGDDQAASTSAATVLTVDHAATSTSLTLSASSQQYASTRRIAATATVPAIAGEVATGTVAFSLDGKVVARVGLVKGKASWGVPSGTAVGSHRLVATFTPAVSGAAPSTSVARGFTVSKASSSSVLTQRSAMPKGRGFNMAVSVSVPGVAAPTGTVTIKQGKTVVGTATLTAAAKGKLTVGVKAFRSAGSYPLTVTYSGNGSIGASTSKAVTQKIK